MVAPTGKRNTWTLPSITITANKYAQPMGFTYSSGRLTGCTLEASCEISEVTDGLGEPAAHGVSGASGTISSEWGSEEPTITYTLTETVGVTQVPGDQRNRQAAFPHVGERVHPRTRHGSIKQSMKARCIHAERRTMRLRGKRDCATAV